MSTGQNDTYKNGRWGTNSGTSCDRTSTDREEQQNLRRLQAMMHLLIASIEQDRTMTVDQAAQMVANTRQSALRMFPNKESTFNMLCRPRIQRAMRERFQIQ